MSEKTYTLKVEVRTRGFAPAQEQNDEAQLVAHLEKDIKDTCNRDLRESEIRFISLVLQ